MPASSKSKPQVKIPIYLNQLLDNHILTYGGNPTKLKYEVWAAINKGQEENIANDLRDNLPFREWSIFATERAKFEKMCKSRLEKPAGAIKGKYTCKKCGFKEFFADEMQTRGGDEGMTLFVKCGACGSRFKA
jgi:DNA-directed RNA polymerase subunit M/transcription elongation factor TFIIS